VIRAVLDTNVIVSGIILLRGLPYAILEAWRHGRFRLVTTVEQRAEIARVVHRPKFAARYAPDEAEIDGLLFRLARDSEVISISVIDSPITVRDPDDEHVLAAAMASNADFLVSGDKDLLVLAGDPRLGTLQIVPPRAFIDALDPANDAAL